MRKINDLREIKGISNLRVMVRYEDGEVLVGTTKIANHDDLSKIGVELFHTLIIYDNGQGFDNLDEELPFSSIVEIHLLEKGDCGYETY